LITKKLAP